MTGCYLDASAIVKLVTDEPESLALRDWLKPRGPLLTSRISTIEVARAIRRKDESAQSGRSALDETFTAVGIVELDAAIADRAAGLSPTTLRAVDAIHLATALAIADEVAAFATYDSRLAGAARAVGLEVVAPA